MKNTIIIDEKIDEIYEEFFKNRGFDIIKINKDSNLYDEISSHTDIHVLKIGEDIVFDPVSYENIGLKGIVKGKSKLERNYPYDIKYNVCILGDLAIHNFKYTDEKVLEILDKKGYRKIDINQGYTNCAIAKITDTSCITSDSKIAFTLKEEGIDVLLISSENEKDIKLLKNDLSFSNMHGFIGGATIKIENDIILFGDKKYLKDFEKVEDFIEEQGCHLIDFKDRNIIDYGSAVIIKGE